jgi:hypothetical protein
LRKPTHLAFTKIDIIFETTKKIMRKIHFTQQHLAIPETILLFTHFLNEHNSLQKDEKGKWIKGANRLRPGHFEVFKALLVLLKENSIKQQNKLYMITGRGIYNVDKPLILKAYTSDIKNMTLRGLKGGVCNQTIKNYLNKLQEFKIINRQCKTTSKKFEIEFNPEFIVLKNPEDGNFIKNIGFEKYCQSVLSEQKIKNLKDITYKDSNINNKIIHFPNVNKRSLHTQTISSQKYEHLKNENKKVQFSLTDEQTKIETIQSKSENSKTQQTEKSELSVAREILAKKQDEIILKSNKKDAANKFYIKFIATFWKFWLNFYMPETADRSNLNYIAQSIETLVNDDYYFGSCQNQEQINYQLFKLDKSLISTKRWYESKVKENENFSFRYLFPNVFLKNPAEPNSMSFKKSILRTEIQMAKTNELQMQFEKAMQRQKDKKKGDKNNKIIDNIIAWIHSNPKQNTKEMLIQAMKYLHDVDGELVMKLQTDISNPYRIKQAIENCKTFDIKLINECFIGHELIKNEIEKLLPKFQKILQTSGLAKKQATIIKFRIRGNEMQPIPKNYDKDTLKYIQSNIN